MTTPLPYLPLAGETLTLVLATAMPGPWHAGDGAVLLDAAGARLAHARVLSTTAGESGSVQALTLHVEDGAMPADDLAGLHRAPRR
ncbi:MAG: hypothetical protein AAFR52_15825 [Pseudomonadota bacterium]